MYQIDSFGRPKGRNGIWWTTLAIDNGRAGSRAKHVLLPGLVAPHVKVVVNQDSIAFCAGFLIVDRLVLAEVAKWSLFYLCYL